MEDCCARAADQGGVQDATTWNYRSSESYWSWKCADQVHEQDMPRHDWRHDEYHRKWGRESYHRSCREESGRRWGHRLHEQTGGREPREEPPAALRDDRQLRARHGEHQEEKENVGTAERRLHGESNSRGTSRGSRGRGSDAHTIALNGALSSTAALSSSGRGVASWNASSLQEEARGEVATFAAGVADSRRVSSQSVGSAKLEGAGRCGAAQRFGGHAPEQRG